MSDSEDEDLAKAIALSLGQNFQESRAQKNPAVVIDISSDDEVEDDLDAPLAIKKSKLEKAPQIPKMNARANSVLFDVNKKVVGDSVETGKISFQESSSQKPFTPVDNKQLPQISSSEPLQFVPNRLKDEKLPYIGQLTTLSTSQTGLLGLDRKQMEEERLSRILQRTAREISSREAEESHKRKRTPQTPEYNIVRHVKPKHSIPTSPRNVPLVASSRDQQHLLGSGIQFPHGVVKKTWVYGCPRENDIKIEEVLQKEDLELAVLSAFQIEPDWVISKLAPSTKVVWVLQAKTEWDKKNFESQAPANYRFCFPSMEGQINCMHSKLQLLSHPAYLRIVIPSANLVPYDWGETGVMENTVFIIDLPRFLPAERATTLDGLTDFGKELRYFLDAMGLDSKISDSLLKFDFSHTEKLRFVHSIGGSHTGEKWKRTGYCGLGKAVRSLGLQTEEAINIDLVSASIGNLNDGFIKAMYLAAQGDSGITEYDWRTKHLYNGTAIMLKQQRVSELIKERFRVYFPTEDTVTHSRGGKGAGGTICFQAKWYNSSGFPKYLLRDCKSRRPGILMHSKMLLVRPDDAALSGWCYIGSANLSESAWGRLVKDRTTKEPKLNIRNWECGVILEVSGINAESGERTIQLDVSSIDIPVPMVIPGEIYRADQQPWYYIHGQ